MTGVTPEPRPEAAGHEHSADWATIGFAIVIIAAGAYFLLKDTLRIALPDISWDAAWPVLLILVGVLALIRGWTGGHRHRRHAR